MSQQAWSRWRFAGVVCLLAFAWAALAWPWLSGHVTIPFDAKAHFQAQIQFLSNALHKGESPFWTPHVFGGSPQIADPQSMIFSPAIILAALIPNPSFRAVDIFTYLLLLAGSLGVLMIFRDRHWHPAAALVAAIAFAFGASAAWRIQHIGQIESYAFFGLALWTFLRALDRRSVLWSLWAGVATGLMILDPDQVAFMGALVLGVIGIGWSAARWQDSQSFGGWLGTNLRVLLPATIVTLAIIALPMLWTMLFAEASNRPAVAYAEAARAALHPAHLLTVWIGDLFGALDRSVEYWGPSSEAWDPKNLSLSQNMGQVYLGALPGLLILVPGLTRGLLFAREIRLLTIAFALCLLYGLGGLTPVFGLMFDHIPGVSTFRRPADATFMIGGLGAVLGGYVLHRAITRTLPAVSALHKALEAGLILLVLVAGLATAWSAGKFALAVQPVMLALLWLGLAALVVRTLSRLGPARPVLAASLATGLMVADLRANNGPNESTALPPSVYEVLDPNCKNETIRTIKKLVQAAPGSPRRDRVELAGIGFDWPNAGLVHGFDHTLGYNPLRLADYNEASGARDTIAGWDQKRFTALYPGYRSTFANMLGLRYIASKVPLERIDKTLAPGEFPIIARTGDAMIYENRNALPRAMFVAGWKTVDFETVLDEGLPQGFDPTRTVLIETQIEEGEGPAAATATGRATVTMKTYTNTVIELEVTSDRAGFVVLNDVWHPWWTVSVNGEERELLKANVIFRAAQVSAGTSLVRFEFRPLEGAMAELREKLSGSTEEKDEDTPASPAPPATPAAPAR